MPSWRLDEAAVERLYRAAKADRWKLPTAVFADALEQSARRVFPEPPDPRTLERHLSALHLEDLALACACAEGIEMAWDHFVREFRPILYRAADAIDGSGGSRELADSLYGELFGLTERDGERRSHFRYFHGRSGLATWLRAVLSQRHVDRLRSVRRMDPVPADDAPNAIAASTRAVNPRREQYVTLMRRCLASAIGALAPRDRLRLGCYYAQELTLAQIGKALGEHEGTVSRHLSRTRRVIRERIEIELRDTEGFSEAQVKDCFEAVVSDPGPLDLTDVLGTKPAGKKVTPERSTEERA
jgi:RNA polymerase sigma-70 factor, ECF subfamily